MASGNERIGTGWVDTEQLCVSSLHLKWKVKSSFAMSRDRPAGWVTASAVLCRSKRSTGGIATARSNGDKRPMSDKLAKR